MLTGIALVLTGVIMSTIYHVVAEKTRKKAASVPREEFINRKFTYSGFACGVYTLLSALLVGIFLLPIMYMEHIWQLLLLLPFLALWIYFMYYGVRVMPKIYVEIDGKTIREYKGENLKYSFELKDIESIRNKYFMFLVELKNGDVKQVPQMLVNSSVLYAYMMRAEDEGIFQVTNREN